MNIFDIIKRAFTISGALLLFVACNKGSPDITSGSKMILNGTIEQSLPETKTYFGDKDAKSGITPLLWSNGDVISVFTGTNTSNKPFVLISGVDSPNGVFEGSFLEQKTYYAFYPYSDIISISYNSDLPTFSFSLPLVQKYRDGNIADGVNPTVAYTTNGGDLKFKNICGVIGLQLKIVSGTRRLSKITLVAEKSKLSGTAKVLMNYNLANGNPSILMDTGSSARDSVSLNMRADSVELTSTSKFFYIVTPPFSVSSDNKLKVIVTGYDGAEISKETSNVKCIVTRGGRLIMPELECVFLLPAVITSAISSITNVSATFGGNVTSEGKSAVTQKGVCWSTSAKPTISDTKTTNGAGTGVFSNKITNLTLGTTYYVRAYATNSAGTAYGEERSFKTQLVVPILTTADVSSITYSTASSGGNISDDGGASVTSRGVCWSTSQNPTISDSKTVNDYGKGTYSSTINDLAHNTTYYVRAYATNSVGTGYGEEKSFKTKSYPSFHYIDNGVDYGESIPINLGSTIGIRYFAPVNCGYEAATTTPTYKGYPYGKLYQWGRRYGHGYDSNDATIPTVSQGPVSNSIGQDAVNRNVFYRNSSSYYDWCAPKDDKLWNIGTDAAPQKAVNDPCPKGWRVPTTAELQALITNKSNWSSYNGQNGYWFSGVVSYRVDKQNKNAIFLSAAGNIIYNTGSAADRSSVGYYWSSLPYSYYSYSLRFYNGSAEVYYYYYYNYYYYRAYGRSVRCIKQPSLPIEGDEEYGDNNGGW